jgi:hypothetical protein
VSYESMIGYTADLGKCLFDAGVSTCYTHVYTKVFHVWVLPSCGDNDVIRMMVRVITTVVCVSRIRVERVDKVTVFMHSWELG